MDQIGKKTLKWLGDNGLEISEENQQQVLQFAVSNKKITKLSKKEDRKYAFTFDELVILLNKYRSLHESSIEGFLKRIEGNHRKYVEKLAYQAYSGMTYEDLKKNKNDAEEDVAG